MQEPDYSLRELVSETGYCNGDFGKADPAKGLPGTSMAAVKSSQGSPFNAFNVFFQGPDRAIYEKKITNGWQPPRKVVLDAMTLTGLSAVSANGRLFRVPFCSYKVKILSTDLNRVRLYYQDSNSSIRELRFAVGSWTQGFNFPIRVPSHTNMAAVAWSDEAQIRLFVQDDTMDIIEWSYNVQDGWQSTPFRTKAMPFTDIAATTMTLDGVQYIWLYFHGANGTLQIRICSEVDDVASWTDAQNLM
jgi:hypothetical protein